MGCRPEGTKLVEVTLESAQFTTGDGMERVVVIEGYLGCRGW